MILISLTKKCNLGIHHVFEEYEINEEYVKISISTVQYFLAH